jgi:hypothetical protein
MGPHAKGTPRASIWNSGGLQRVSVCRELAAGDRPVVSQVVARVCKTPMARARDGAYPLRTMKKSAAKKRMRIATGVRAGMSSSGGSGGGVSSVSGAGGVSSAGGANGVGGAR